jgi:hypothetical protein
MIPQSAADYGSLAPLVKMVGWLMSSALAISLAWRRRAKWEPVEEDVANGPTRVAGLLTAVAVAVVWARLASNAHIELLTRLAISLGVVALVALIAYGMITSAFVYKKILATGRNKTEERSVIGGFALTEQARNVMRKRKLTVQELFAGASYDHDKVWTRGSRALAKATFAMSYVVLVVSGSIALTCAAVLLLMSSPAAQSGGG